MHFTTLFVLNGKTLDNTSTMEIEEEFSIRYCYCCGEQHPKYRYWCDWFQIGGRWNDSNVLKSKKGLYGKNGVGDGYGKPTPSVIEIKDLKGKINKEFIYAIATKSRIYESDSEKFVELLDKINNKQINGVIALIDCHD